MTAINLLRHDPELFRELDGAALRDVHEATVPAFQVEEGPWKLPAVDSSRAPFGFLLLQGFLARETVLGEGSSLEILGPGDVARPWVRSADGGDLDLDLDVDVEVEWEALETCVIAALDLRFGSLALRHPVVIATLMDRYIARSNSLSVQLALRNIVGLEKRVETMLWHMAERWGRVCVEGVILPLRLNHEFLAKLVGVRRPSLTSAISRLRQQGVLERRDDGSWLLHERAAGLPEREPEKTAA